MEDTITLPEFPDGERRFVEVEGIEIAVLNVEGEYYAFRNFCPHMGAPLGRGPVSSSADPEGDEKTLSCPFHSWAFYLETGESTFGDLQVATFDTTVEDGEVVISLT